MTQRIDDDGGPIGGFDVDVDEPEEWGTQRDGSYIPSQDEIRAATLEIQKSWSPDEREQRARCSRLPGMDVVDMSRAEPMTIGLANICTE